MRSVTAVLGLVLCLLAGCGVSAPSPSPAPPVPATTGAVAPPSPSLASAAVAATGDAEAARDDVTLGVAVLDRATGDVAVNDEGDTSLRAASVAKLFTVVDVLTRRAEGQVEVTSGDEERIRRALGPSDDEAMNALWSRFDGPEGITRVSERVGLTATEPPDDSSQWGEVTTSARDVAALLGYVVTRLAPADRDLVLGALEAAPGTATDGFDQAFGLLDPQRRGPAAAKQGWLCCLESSVDLNSVGLPDPSGRYALALLSNQPYGYDAARDVLDDAAGAARDALGG